MSDANKQSVERCKYGHDWRMKDRIRCAVCDALPNAKQQMQAESIVRLHELLQPGDPVYTILNGVSRSGMNRRISVAVGDGKAINNITWNVAHALGEPIKNRAGYVQDVGISVGGCGMDMGFELVYNLGRVLYPHGFVCPGEGCQSNDHVNEYKKYQNFKGQMHTGDGGYALKHKWL